MKPLDLSKPLQTRDGQPVTVLTTERPDSLHPVVGMTNAGLILTYTAQGKVYSGGREHELDLQNVPEKRTFWINVCEGQQTGHPSRRLSDYFALPDRIACVEVTYIKGDGL